MRSVAHLIAWRDLRAVLTGVSGYVLLAGFLALTGWTFAGLLHRNEGGFAPASAIWGLAVAPWLPVLAAAATMRLFAEERQTGTMELLLTAPVRPYDVVLGKFAAALALVCGGILLALIQARVLRHVAPRMDGGFSSAGLLAASGMLFLQAAAWTAVGTLAALLARQQGIAALLTLLGIGAPYALRAAVAAWAPGMRHGLWHWPPLEDVTNAATGLFSLAPPVLYVSMAWCALFLCVRLLEARDLRTR